MTRPIHPPKSQIFRPSDVLDLFHESAAGIALSGDSGSGKSNAMAVLLDALLRSPDPPGITLIDPHGDLAADFESNCSALPQRIRNRVLVVRPSNLQHIVSLNPLAVPSQGIDSLTWRARVASRVAHVARTLLYAWGETDFNSKPVLFKWCIRVLTTLAVAALTIPEARHFFEIGGEVYQALANATPDLIGRMEMNELAGMRPREREDLIASTKNRFLGFLNNPVIELVLGRPSGWLDMRQLVLGRYITIVSLELGGVLREEDREILANLYLCELLDTVFNLPRHERTEHVLAIDELPIFKSSFDVIARAAAQTRKYKVRFAPAFQGTQMFPERIDDPLLNALISQCRTTIVFRHKNPVDAKYYAELLTLPTFGPLKEKHRLTQLQQYQAGNDVVFLTDEADNWSDAKQQGGSQSTAESTAESAATADNRSAGTTTSVSRDEETLREVTSRARSQQAGNSTSRTTSSGKSNTDGTNWSDITSRGGSRTRKMTLVPRLRWRRIVSSVQFLTPEEQLAIGAREIATQATGEAIVYTAGQLPIRVRFPQARGPYDRTPKFARKKVEKLEAEVVSKPAFATCAQIIAEREEFQRQLIAYLEQHSAEGRGGITAADLQDESHSNPLLSI